MAAGSVARRVCFSREQTAIVSPTLKHETQLPTRSRASPGAGPGTSGAEPGAGRAAPGAEPGTAGEVSKTPTPTGTLLELCRSSAGSSSRKMSRGSSSSLPTMFLETLVAGQHLELLLADLLQYMLLVELADQLFADQLLADRLVLIAGQHLGLFADKLDADCVLAQAR